MTPAMTPQQPGHAEGWMWRADQAGVTERPWGWSTINGNPDLPPHDSGLCVGGWHVDCPQAPIRIAGPGQCSCPCHQGVKPPMHISEAQPDLFGGAQ